MVFEINDESFKKEVMESDVPVVVDFWAPWCSPCRALAPLTEKLAGQYQGKVKFCKINVDENQVTAGEYGVMSIPTLAFLKNGKLIDTSVGLLPESALKPKVESLLQAA
jgi:thioredoxin 1